VPRATPVTGRVKYDLIGTVVWKSARLVVISVPATMAAVPASTKMPAL
jgi:hypothetical protein